jgi:hypothetical protein
MKDIPLFKFSIDDLKALKTILKGFDDRKVRGFLNVVSLYAFIFFKFKKNSFPKVDIQKHFLPDLKQCSKTLERIMGGFSVDPQRDFKAWIDRDVKDQILKGETVDILALKAAEKAYPHIKDLEKILKEVLAKSKKKRGERSRADQTGFVRELAKIYKIHLGKDPSKWKGGIFHNFISCLWGILFPRNSGEIQDVSRAVRAAIEANNRQDAS